MPSDPHIELDWVDLQGDDPITLTGCPLCKQTGRCMRSCDKGVVSRVTAEGQTLFVSCTSCRANFRGSCRLCEGEGMVPAAVARQWRTGKQ